VRRSCWRCLNPKNNGRRHGIWIEHTHSSPGEQGAADPIALAHSVGTLVRGSVGWQVAWCISASSRGRWKVIQGPMVASWVFVWASYGGVGAIVASWRRLEALGSLLVAYAWPMGVLGIVLNASWGLLESSWWRFGGPSSGLVGRSWRHLKSSWRFHKGFLRALGILLPNHIHLDYCWLKCVFNGCLCCESCFGRLAKLSGALGGLLMFLGRLLTRLEILQAAFEAVLNGPKVGQEPPTPRPASASCDPPCGRQRPSRSWPRRLRG